MQNNRNMLGLFLIAVWALILCAVYWDWADIRFQFVFWANMVAPLAPLYSLGLALLAFDFIFFAAGSYLLLRDGKANLCLSTALLIASFELEIKGNRIETLLSFYQSLRFNFSDYGIGLNLVGLVLLIAYLRLTAPHLFLIKNAVRTVFSRN